jgi:hypothetical protein
MFKKVEEMFMFYFPRLKPLQVLFFHLGKKIEAGANIRYFGEENLEK